MLLMTLLMMMMMMMLVVAVSADADVDEHRARAPAPAPAAAAAAHPGHPPAHRAPPRPMRVRMIAGEDVDVGKVVPGTNMTCYVHSLDEVICNGTVFDTLSDEQIEFNTPEFWEYVAIIISLVLMAGTMSGLTMGLLSLDAMTLGVLKNSGTPQEQKHATTILPLIERHHLLLVTLLLSNAACMEALPIFLDRISSPIIAVVVSVSLVLFFGEVIPQALCTRYGLSIGANMAWLVKILMVLTFPLSYPIAKLLDCLLGHENKTFFRRAQLKELVYQHGQIAEENQDPLSVDEVSIIKGAIELRNKSVRDSMTPLVSVVMLNVRGLLDRPTLKRIQGCGHSRIPVYENDRTNIIGLILAKNLILVDPDDNVPIQHVMTRRLPKVRADLPLYDLLNEFQTGKSHMAVVVDTPQADEAGEAQPHKVVLGVITLEDVIEELIQEEIIDETDVYVDVHKKIRVARVLQQMGDSSASFDAAIIRAANGTASPRGSVQRTSIVPGMGHSATNAGTAPAGPVPRTSVVTQPDFYRPPGSGRPGLAHQSSVDLNSSVVYFASQDSRSPSRGGLGAGNSNGYQMGESHDARVVHIDESPMVTRRHISGSINGQADERTLLLP
ncbi:CBS domain-containing protein [Capsaspora owczarzaki ATCC 30864]|nr:CBS domain-containing protein [Capsaspora owczarzaki ATCC 30864]|eukprot:XP_004345603.2 CBS domain-containing protein [Capsaspora owczarzaki ATCC 30864]